MTGRPVGLSKKFFFRTLSSSELAYIHVKKKNEAPATLQPTRATLQHCASQGFHCLNPAPCFKQARAVLHGIKDLFTSRRGRGQLTAATFFVCVCALNAFFFSWCHVDAASHTCALASMPSASNRPVPPVHGLTQLTRLCVCFRLREWYDGVRALLLPFSALSLLLAAAPPRAVHEGRTQRSTFVNPSHCRSEEG